MADRQFVVVVSPARIKWILDGSKCVIIYPGASQEQLEKLQAAIDELRTLPDLSVRAIKPDSIEVEWVEVGRIREIRSE